MGYKSKETKITPELEAEVNTYVDAVKRRFRADALRELITFGLTSDGIVAGYNIKGEKRLVLGVTKELDDGVEAVRQSLAGDEATYEVAYRLVVLRGLRVFAAAG